MYRVERGHIGALAIMRPNAIFAIACFAALSAGAAFTSPLPISEVARMSGSGARPQDVIERLRVSQTSYALRGSDFGKLKAAGVADEVLDYLQQSFVSNVDQLTRYSMVGPRLGGCSYCYPQPVDVDRMISGFGIASSAVPGRRPAGLPAGVPEWVLPSLRGAPATGISVSEIVDMAKRGVSDSQIVDLLRHSRLEGVIGVARSNVVLEHLIAGISGSQLARWRSEGVSDPVLDALQGRFLAQLVELDRLRYQNWL
jgi:hypothetical protein